MRGGENGDDDDGGSSTRADGAGGTGDEALLRAGAVPDVLPAARLALLGRQRVTVSNERIVIEQGFWTRTRDDVEIFRIRDVVVKQSLFHRVAGIGDVIVKSLEGRTEEQHVLRGLADPVRVSETIRGLWNRTARPQGPAATLD